MRSDDPEMPSLGVSVSCVTHRLSFSPLCLRALLVILLLSVGACASKPVQPTATYTVKRGDTLYSIAWRHSLDYHDLARWNRIGRDYTIYPGQVLRLTAD